MSSLLRTIFGYHAWANSEWLDTLERLDPNLHKAELETARRLISHYHVVARLFAARLVGEKEEGIVEDPADASPLEELRSQLAATDQWYLDYIDRTTKDVMSAFVPFTFVDGKKGWMSREEMITHVVMHAGYHRGEMGRVLSQVSATLPWDTFAVFLHRTQPARRRQGEEESSAA